MSSTIESRRNGEGKHEALRTRKRGGGAMILPMGGETLGQSRTKKPVRGFGKVRQREFLELLMQGASPQVACRKLKLPIAAFWQTLEHNAGFAAELQKVWDALSFNVVAALYQAAMKGNSTAQQFWLKHRPPPRWSQLPGGSILTDDLETLTNAELLDRARQEAPDFAAEIAARVAETGSGLAPQTVPGTDLRPGE